MTLIADKRILINKMPPELKPQPGQTKNPKWPRMFTVGASPFK